MTKEVFCYRLTYQIRCRYVHKELCRELTGHIEDRQAELEASGLSPRKAEEQAVAAMGDPVEIGRELDRLYDPRWYTLLQVLNWVVGVLAVLSLVVGTVLWVDEYATLPTLFLPHADKFERMTWESPWQNGQRQVCLWVGECREEATLDPYTVSISDVALIREDYWVRGVKQCTYRLSGTVWADHWQPWLRSMRGCTMTITDSLGRQSDPIPLSIGTFAVFSVRYSFDVELPDASAEWFSATFDFGNQQVTLPVTPMEVEE